MGGGGREWEEEKKGEGIEKKSNTWDELDIPCLLLFNRYYFIK